VKLSDLEPQFVRFGENGGLRKVSTLAEAQGIRFVCPKCGEHQILIWFRDRGTPDEARPAPGRWAVSGSGYHDLTITPSINLDIPGATGCRWHGFVTNGETT
jgi:hypothetical protein